MYQVANRHVAKFSPKNSVYIAYVLKRPKLKGPLIFSFHYYRIAVFIRTQTRAFQHTLAIHLQPRRAYTTSRRNFVTTLYKNMARLPRKSK